MRSSMAPLDANTRSTEAFSRWLARVGSETAFVSCSLRSQWKQRSGVTVRETRKEAKSENEIVKVRGMKSKRD